jgi:hypothetical protein
MRSSLQSLITVENQHYDTFDTRNALLLDKGISRTSSKNRPSRYWDANTSSLCAAREQFRSQSSLSLMGGGGTYKNLLTTVDTSNRNLDSVYPPRSKFSINDTIVSKNRKKLLPTPLIMRKHNEFSSVSNID